MPKAERDSLSKMLMALAHPLRRQILHALSDDSKSFSEIQRLLGIESGHLSYHMQALKGLVATDQNQRYCLTRDGLRALESATARNVCLKRGTERIEWSPRFAYSLMFLAILLFGFAYATGTWAQNGGLLIQFGGSGYWETPNSPFMIQDQAGFLHVYYAGYDVRNSTEYLKTMISTVPFPTALGGGFQAFFDMSRMIGQGDYPIWVTQTRNGTFVILYLHLLPAGTDLKPTAGIWYRTSVDGVSWGEENILIEESMLPNKQDPYSSFSLAQDQVGTFWLAYTSNYRNTVELRSANTLQDMGKAQPLIVAKYSDISPDKGCPTPCSTPNTVVMAQTRTGRYSVAWGIDTFTGNYTYTGWASYSSNGIVWTAPVKLPFDQVHSLWMTIAQDDSYVILWTDNNISCCSSTDADGTVFVGRPSANIRVSRSRDGIDWEQATTLVRTAGAPAPKLVILSDGTYALVSDGPGWLWFLLRSPPGAMISLPEFAVPTVIGSISLFAAMVSIIRLRRRNSSEKDPVSHS